MQGGRRRRQWMRDFANAELADDEGDVPAAVARDLARGAVIPAGGKEVEEEEEEVLRTEYFGTYS
jgi:hypothetical protein